MTEKKQTKEQKIEEEKIEETAKETPEAKEDDVEYDIHMGNPDLNANAQAVQLESSQK